jgi:tRNA(fMet)-specific endonuclease VapC
LAHRFFQYAGGIAISSISLAELYAGAYKRAQPARFLALIADLLQDVAVLNFDSACAEQFGKTRGVLLQQGIQVATADLMIASVALVHNLTLVTHNTADFQNIPGLRLDDWLIP